MRQFLSRANFLPAYLLLGFLLMSGAIVAQPTVNLGSDTVLCGGSLLLDAGNPGASYLWNDGSTNQTLLANSSGIYWVDVTDGSGTTRDSVEIELVAIPATPMVGDTAVCGNPEISLNSNTNAQFTFWRLDSIGFPLLSSASVLEYQVNGNSQLIIEAVNPGGLESNGFFDPAAGPSGNYFSLPSGRGIRFDVFRPSTLLSVDVYAQAGSQATVVLTTSTGTILDSLQVQLQNQGKNEVFLGFSLIPGTAYRLLLQNTAGAFYLITSTAYNFPQTQIKPTRGHPLSNQYPAFFNLQVADIVCSSTADTASITTLFQPTANLGGDTVICSGQYQLDLGGSGGNSFLWNTGEVSSAILVDTTGIFWGEAVSGTCADRDSILVEFLSSPSQLPVPDTTLCGSQEIQLSSTEPADVTLWYDAASGGNILSQDTFLSTFTRQSTTYYIERLSLPRPDSLGYLSPDETSDGGYFEIQSIKGMNFDVLQPTHLISVDIYVERAGQGNTTPMSAFLTVFNPSGTRLLDQQVMLPEEGSNTIYLNLDLPVGQNYKIQLSEGEGRFYLTFTSAAPFSNDRITIKNGYPIGSQFSYFFNWQMTKSLCSSGRIPVTVSVDLPNLLPDSLYACEPQVLTVPPGTTSALWSTGETASSILADTTMVYSLNATNASTGCSVTYDIDFSLPKQIDLGDDGNFCGNELVSGYPAEAQFLWSTGDSTPNIITTIPGQYWVEVIEPMGCVLSDTITISSFSPNPIVELGNDTATCISFTLLTGLDTLTHQWSTGETSPSITVTSSGLYHVQVTDPLGCSGRDTIGVSITQIPEASFSFDTSGLTVTFINTSGFGTYLWEFGDNTTSSSISPVHTYAAAATYNVRLIVSNQCGSDTLESTIQVRNPVSIEGNELWSQTQVRYDTDRNPWLSVNISDHQPEVQLDIVTLEGQLLSSSTQTFQAGSHQIPLNERILPAGYYLIRITTRTQTATHPFIVPSR